MRPLLLGVIIVLGCAPSLSRSHGVGVMASAPTGTSLLVRGGSAADTLDEWAAFLPVEFDEAGLAGWSAEALRSAGYRLSVVELEDPVESGPERDPENEPGEFLSRRPPRRGGPGGHPGRHPPALNPRPTPQQRQDMQRRAADLAAVQAARKLYHQRLAEAHALYPNSQGYQDHHLVPVYLGGPRSGTTYRIPTAYHKLLTREFRKEWGYDRGEPTAQRLQEILLKVYSQNPIPQLIGITP
ncbi:hypothetical protein [Archangium lansingense]|uniref:Uncharacterized protein n=1 Tax=Archangium lansingense TaxID=2995310 RepID=A0ABT4A9W3_9BACT|nr:hypothetical protein [Archangium lansinium]MCY1078447.1 hypothetical protein [Archangium lansinium]